MHIFDKTCISSLSTKERAKRVEKQTNKQASIYLQRGLAPLTLNAFNSSGCSVFTQLAIKNRSSSKMKIKVPEGIQFVSININASNLFLTNLIFAVLMIYIMFLSM